jgi:hypothetical protein
MSLSEIEHGFLGLPAPATTLQTPSCLSVRPSLTLQLEHHALYYFVETSEHSHGFCQIAFKKHDKR